MPPRVLLMGEVVVVCLCVAVMLLCVMTLCWKQVVGCNVFRNTIIISVVSVVMSFGDDEFNEISYVSKISGSIGPDLSKYYVISD